MLFCLLINEESYSRTPSIFMSCHMIGLHMEGAASALADSFMLVIVLPVNDLFVFAINADQTREKYIATKLLLLIMVENKDAQ